jgi:nitric oxide reductase NorD protein
MEEQVGVLWHRFITRAADQSYPQAEVRLQDIRKGLGLFFRALGGDGGLPLEVADQLNTRSRRNWLQKLAGSGSKINAGYLDAKALKLPARIACFDNAEHNRMLYYWLAALAAHQQRIIDPAMDSWINRNQLAALLTLQSYPGLIAKYQTLVKAHLIQRPDLSSLTEKERAMERAIRRALLEPGSVSHLPVARLDPYPVPLWLYDAEQGPAGESGNKLDDEQAGPRGRDDSHELEDMSRRKAERVKEPEKDRGLVTIRMENIFTWGEFVNVDRGQEDEEDAERAEAIARDLDKLAVSQQQQSGGIRLKFDLDLPSEAEDDRILSDGLLLPEWDWKQGRLLDKHCHIVEMIARDAKASALPAELIATARQLKKQFQRLTPARTWLPHQIDGQEIDLEACLRYMAERRAGLAVDTEHFYRDLKQGKRDMACLLLADLSLSTDSWVSDHQRVIDVIRDSLWLFGESLNAVGDMFAIYGFSSRRRDPVRVHRLKSFAESYGEEIRGRIAEIKPGYYTRLGAGIRYAAMQLTRQPASRQLLLILTDGKPNDLDQYEGRYGIEDTRQAILEARKLGLRPFCVTIDRHGNDYLPHLFGKNGYIVIRNPLQMPKYLPKLYVQLTQDN